MIRRTLQKHFFLLLFAVLVLAICFMVGLGLAQYPNASKLAGVINTHAGYLLLWRILVYTTVIYYWPRAVNAMTRRRYNNAAETLPDKIANRRQPIVLVCLAFEFLIVQNITGLLLAYFFNGKFG